MKTFFTADTHFDSKSVMSMRDFSSPADHDEYVVARINEMVGYHDRLIIAGDFCMRSAKHVLGSITCKNTYLVIGNHDRAQSIRAFKSAEETMMLKIGEHKVFISHYPHAYWPASHYGSLHLYGHVHAQREETLDMVFPGRRSMDIGLDNAKRLVGDYRPFTEDEIVSFLAPQAGHDPVEFYRNRRKLAAGFED